MRVTKANVTRTCAVCERTLLMGEHTLRFSPDGHEFVDVCPLCSDVALDHGWVREGHAVSPALQQHPRRKRQKTLWQALLGARDEEAEPVVSEPILRRLSDDELALVEAADLFNQSTFRRTVAGVAKSLGDPKVSIVPLRRRQRGDRPDLRLGHHLVPVPRHAGRGPAGADRRPRARPRRGRARPTRAGTPASTRRAGSCRELATV